MSRCKRLLSQYIRWMLRPKMSYLLPNQHRIKTPNRIAVTLTLWPWKGTRLAQPSVQPPTPLPRANLTAVPGHRGADLTEQSALTPRPRPQPPARPPAPQTPSHALSSPPCTAALRHSCLGSLASCRTGTAAVTGGFQDGPADRWRAVCALTVVLAMHLCQTWTHLA